LSKKGKKRCEEQKERTKTERVKWKKRMGESGNRGKKE
jgi:hypothetical protein